MVLIVAFSNNTTSIFTVKKNAKVFKGTVWAFDMFGTIILPFLSHGVFTGKAEQNPITQTQKLSAIDSLIIVYNKITVKAIGFNKL